MSTPEPNVAESSPTTGANVTDPICAVPNESGAVSPPFGPVPIVPPNMSAATGSTAASTSGRMPTAVAWNRRFAGSKLKSRVSAAATLSRGLGGPSNSTAFGRPSVESWTSVPVPVLTSPLGCASA